jgi:ketosteroid isomerase-like protein
MKKTIQFPLLLLIFAILFTIGCEQRHDLEKIRTEVNAINDHSIQAILENTPDSTLKYYADDAVSMPSYQPMMKGMEAFKESIEKQKENPMNMKSFTLNSTELLVSGKFVVDIGTYDLVIDMPDAPGGEFNDKGKYLTLFEIQDDGSLLVKAETWNTDLNPWEMMAQGKEEGKEEKK